MRPGGRGLAKRGNMAAKAGVIPGFGRFLVAGSVMRVVAGGALQPTVAFAKTSRHLKAIGGADDLKTVFRRTGGRVVEEQYEVAKRLTGTVRELPAVVLQN